MRIPRLAALLCGTALTGAALAGTAGTARAEALEGFFGSAMVSHSSLQSTVRFPQMGTRPQAQFNDVGGNTIYLGGRGGYAHTFDSGLFLGAEVMGRYAFEPYPTTILNALGFNYELSTKWEVSALARAGVMIGERTAVYGLGGVSSSRLDITLDGRDRSRQLTTPTGGFGLETRLADNWSFRFDWMADRSILRDPLKITLVRWNVGISLSYWF